MMRVKQLGCRLYLLLSHRPPLERPRERRNDGAEQRSGREQRSGTENRKIRVSDLSLLVQPPTRTEYGIFQFDCLIGPTTSSPAGLVLMGG